jgi:hypothetical protein
VREFHFHFKGFTLFPVGRGEGEGGPKNSSIFISSRTHRHFINPGKPPGFFLGSGKESGPPDPRFSEFPPDLLFVDEDQRLLQKIFRIISIVKETHGVIAVVAQNDPAVSGDL